MSEYDHLTGGVGVLEEGDLVADLWADVYVMVIRGLGCRIVWEFL